MYIKRIKIQNIRSISDFEMTFPKPEGWHVLIGENGSGKSSIVRAVAAALVGMPEIYAAQIAWNSWLKKGEKSGSVNLELGLDNQYDALDKNQNLNPNLELMRVPNHEFVHVVTTKIQTQLEEPQVAYNFGGYEGSFSAGYGPLRRFTGGDEKKKGFSESNPKIDAHLSLFGEDVALTEALKWLWDIYNKHHKNLSELFNLELRKLGRVMPMMPSEVDDLLKHLETMDSSGIFPNIKSFLNNSSLLPNNTKLEGFDEDKNIIFTDAQGNKIPVVEMSDGYRSILSLMFDLIRQLVRVYGEEAVFKNIQAGEMNIPLPGVVLIDEIDAHLHPNWQISIGQWFTKCFPKIQFIVTTHSPFVCRACEEDKGTIWQLAAPINGEEQHREIIGDEKKRLIYGNILDAYGTRLFGDSSVRSIKSEEKLQRLGRLNARYALGKITKEEEVERSELLKILKTDDPTGF